MIDIDSTLNNNTKFSGPLIMGHDKMEISKKLLEDVSFCLFWCFIGKFWLFIYGVSRTPNNTYIGQVKILKFTKINKQIILDSAKQTLDLTFKYLFC